MRDRDAVEWPPLAGLVGDLNHLALGHRRIRLILQGPNGAAIGVVSNDP